MIFKQWQQVLDGTKTQTRRLVKQGEQLKFDDPPYNPWPFSSTVLRDWRFKWMVGKTYAVQPRRGKPAVWRRPDGTATPTPLDEYVQKTGGIRATWGPEVKRWLRARGYTEARIRITEIRRERLQDISREDIEAEGTPCNPMNQLSWRNDYYQRLRDFAWLWDSIHKKPGTRWEDDPKVFPLTFELAP